MGTWVASLPWLSWIVQAGCWEVVVAGHVCTHERVHELRTQQGSSGNRGQGWALRSPCSQTDSCAITYFFFRAQSLSCVGLFATPRTVAHQAPLSMDFPGKNTRMCCHFLLQGIFPIQRSNPHILCLLH